MTMIRRRMAGIAVVALMAPSGCSYYGDEPGMKPTITEQQAVQQARDYILEVAAAVFPSHELKPDLADVLPCDDPSDNGPKGRVSAGATYYVLNVPESDLPRAFDAFNSWLAAHDFGLLRDDRPKEPHIRGEHRKNGFRLGFAFSSYTGAYFVTDSPCVWPNGTPAPKK